MRTLLVAASLPPAMRRLGPMTAMAMLAACGHHPKIEPAVPAPVPTPTAIGPAAGPSTVQVVPGLSPQQRYEGAFQLLRQGNTVQARAELATLLQSRPGDRRASHLLREIDTNPRELFGNESFAYVVRPGDTLFSLARRYLRDAADFYALGRFNNLTFPIELQPGQTIMIPGHARSPERVPAPRRPAPTASQAAPARPDEPARPTPSATDRARAQRLREQGLEQMSAGSIDRAVALLSQAAVLDPKNGAIAGELVRARRIQATVHSQ